MPHVPYEIVAIEANRIIINMVMSPSWEQSDYWGLYISYLEVCGWDDFSFDKETLRRIDLEWFNF